MWWENPERHCARRDPDMFFPHSRAGELWAKAVCRGCPVLEACLEDALTYEGTRARGSRFGIVGQTTPAERARIARRRYLPETG